MRSLDFKSNWVFSVLFAVSCFGASAAMMFSETRHVEAIAASIPVKQYQVTFMDERGIELKSEVFEGTEYLVVDRTLTILNNHIAWPHNRVVQAVGNFMVHEAAD